MGQLGDGMAGKAHVRATPVRIPGLSGVKAIRAGGNTTCAIVNAGALADAGEGGAASPGEVACWGDGRFGQLGNGHAEDGYFVSSPIAVGGIMDAIDLAVAGPNVCVVLSDGSVRCWGLNDPTEWLGFASPDCGPFVTENSPMPVALPCESAPREVPMLSGASRVASGGSHNCALVAGGVVSCWGADSFGQLGDGKAGKGSHNPIPTQVPGLSSVEAITVGSSHTCALLADQTVKCWGDNSFGQVGSGIDALDSYEASPSAVSTLDNIVALDAAGRTACAASMAGAVRCWGETHDIFESPPDPVKGRALLPTLVAGVSGAREVRSGGFHACVREDTGRVICWGLNDHGQVGSGSIGGDDYSLSPVAM